MLKNSSIFTINVFYCKIICIHRFMPIIILLIPLTTDKDDVQGFKK